MRKYNKLGLLLLCGIVVLAGCKKEDKKTDTTVVEETTQISIVETQEVTTAGLEEISGVITFEGNSIQNAQGNSSVIKMENGNTAGNLNNSGIVCETSSKLYYMNQADNRRLYVMNRDGSDKSALGKISGAIELNVKDDYIYYQSSGIARAKLKDGAEEILVQDNCRNMVVTEDAIYYIRVDGDNSHIYRMNLDGSEQTLLSENIASGLNVSKGIIYYINNSDSGKIYSMNLDGSNNVEFYDAKNVKELLLDSLYVYYVNKNNHICRISKGINAQTELTADSCSNVNINAGMMYYYNVTKKALCVAECDGTEEKELYSGDLNAINVTSKWIYFFNMNDHQYYRVGKDGNNVEIVE